MTVDIDTAVPVWILRVLIATIAASCTLLVTSHTAHWVFAAGLVTAMIVRPAPAASAGVAVGAGLLVLASGSESFDLRVLPLTFGLHFTLQLAALTAGLAWTTTVETTVLAAGTRPFLTIQALTQTTGAAGAWVTSQQPSSAWLPIAAAAAVATLAWTILLRLYHHQH